MSSHPPAAPKSRWTAFTISVAAASLTILDLSKVNVALPTIESGLGATTVDLQLIVAGYALAFGLLLVPSGRLGDIGSRKRLFILGLVLFGMASLVCGAAVNPVMLVAARALQGVAAGILMPQVLGAIQELFRGRERGMAFGLFGAIIGVSTAFGPALGGLLIAFGGDDLGWRLAFWMNVPIMLVLLPFAIRKLPGAQEHAGKSTIDPIGILLLGAAVFCLMLPFVFTSGRPDDDPNRWYWLVGFVVAALAFIAWERRYRARGNDPVLDFALLRHRSYRYGLLLSSAYFAAMPGVFLVVTLFLQQGHLFSALEAGLVTIPFALASAVTAWFSGRFVHSHGRAIVLAGLCTVTAGFALVLLAALFVQHEALPWAIAAGMLVAGSGGGAVISPNQTLMLSEVPVVQGGVAGSFAQVGQRAGTAIGVAAISSTFFATVYRETPMLDQATVYGHGLAGGFLVAFGFLAAAIVFGVLDRPREPAREVGAGA